MSHELLKENSCKESYSQILHQSMVYFKRGVQPKYGHQIEKCADKTKNVESKIAFLLQEISFF